MNDQTDTSVYVTGSGDCKDTVTIDFQDMDAAED
jgi:hypothetical protein